MQQIRRKRTCHHDPVTSTRPEAARLGHTSRFAGLVRDPARFAALLVAAALVAAIVGTMTTAEAAAEGIAAPNWFVRLGIPVARTLLDLGAVATAGLALLPKMIGFDDPSASEPALLAPRRAASWAAALWGISALAAIVLLTAELERPTPAAIWRYIGAVAAGKGLLLSAGCALLSFWLAGLAIRHGEQVPAELRVAVAVFGLLPLPLTGHASAWAYHDLSMVSMELHVAAASAWAGGLGAIVIFLARRPALLATALPRYSKLATWCVLVVGVSGIFNGLLELALSPVTALPASLFTTRYGVLVLAKAVCFGLVGLVALHVRIRLLPAIAAGRRTTLTFWCGLELLTLAAAFGIAVVLTRTAVTPW